VYIEKRRRKYFALHTVPEDVREALGGRVRFCAALKTDSLKVAQTRARVLEVQWRRLIEQARSQSTDQIEREALFWRQFVEDAPEHEKQLVRDAIADEAQTRVDRAASKSGYTDHRQEGYDDLPVHAEATRFHAIATGKLVRLDEHLDEWLATLAGHQEVKSIATKRTMVQRVAKRFPFVSDVERREVQRWVTERIQEDGWKISTVHRSLSDVRAYWSYLKSLGVALEDTQPFSGLTLPKPSKSAKGDERKPFKPEDVAKLLTATRGSALADLIELAMYTGARIEELCSLKVKGMKHDDKADCDYLEIEDAKTAAGWRQVPVHSMLKVTLRRLLRASKDGYVLSGFVANKNGDRSGALAKRFSALKSKLGYGPGLVFHSIRRTVATMFQDAGVPEHVAANILGHKIGTMTYGLYSGGASLETKSGAIEKLAYPTR
jgi:integrase